MDFLKGFCPLLAAVVFLTWVLPIDPNASGMIAIPLTPSTGSQAKEDIKNTLYWSWLRTVIYLRVIGLRPSAINNIFMIIVLTRMKLSL